jgi:uncharacterized OsmC-like protein
MTHEVLPEVRVVLAGPDPLLAALTALGSCQTSTYRLWAARLGMPLESVSVTVDGDYDPCWQLGIGNSRAGLSSVRVDVALEGLCAEEAACLHSVVNEHSPVLDVFEHRVPVTTTWKKA